MSEKPPEMPKRGIGEPPTSNVIKGPREGFIEDFDTNVQLLKRRIKSKDLAMTEMTVGKYTQTKIAVFHITTIADEKIAEKVIERIKNIEIDGIVDSHYVAEFLQDEKVKLFKQVNSAEKPDVIAAKLLEGRVAVMVEGSPFVLTVPYILFEDLQQSNDYYTQSANVTLKRFVRVAGLLVSILLPGVYVAMMLYHYNILPFNMLITTTNIMEVSPFSPLLEIIFVLILFEIIFEALLNMPKNLGPSVGIFGAIVLGGAAVDASLISAPSILIAAISFVTMHVVTGLSPEVGLLRLFFAIVGGILGLFGIIIGGVALIVYLASIDSYGTPYLSPYSPYIKSDTKDALFKSGVREMVERPKSIPNKNSTRVDNKPKKKSNKQERSR